jgi:hypothetical protein
MTITINPPSIEELWMLLRERLAAPGYADAHATEPAFEAEVWDRVVNLAIDLGMNVSESCLTSHEGRADRSAAAWKEFCDAEVGSHVSIPGSKNRLDIILRHRGCGSIGIEVKCPGGERSCWEADSGSRTSAARIGEPRSNVAGDSLRDGGVARTAASQRGRKQDLQRPQHGRHRRAVKPQAAIGTSGRPPDLLGGRRLTKPLQATSGAAQRLIRNGPIGRSRLSGRMLDGIESP